MGSPLDDVRKLRRMDVIEVAQPSQDGNYYTDLCGQGATVRQGRTILEADSAGGT